MSDHTLYTGSDDEFEYQVREYDDGSRRVQTRPVGGYRWSREVALYPVPSEVCS